jgi:hypothetical protein
MAANLGLWAQDCKLVLCANGNWGRQAVSKRLREWANAQQHCIVMQRALWRR